MNKDTQDLYCPQCGHDLGLTFVDLRGVLDTWLCPGCDTNVKLYNLEDFPKPCVTTPNLKKVCCNCKWWHQYPYMPETIGCCRRHSPTIKGHFPVTNIKDICGDHEVKEK